MQLFPPQLKYDAPPHCPEKLADVNDGITDNDDDDDDDEHSVCKPVDYKADRKNTS